jgi:glucose/mannose-6-phosphate isomerase
MSTVFLDSREQIATLDESNALGSIEMLGDQVQQIWADAQSLSVNPSYSEVDCVVVAGMGGSALGTHVIQTVFKEELKVPVLIAPDYTVPHFVSNRTLVIASSYSGTTEETLAAVEDAHKKGAKIAGITSGGKLAEFLKANNYPALVFEPKYNPCNQPRMALGYSVFGQIALFNRAGILNIQQSQYEEVLKSLADAHLKYGVGVNQDQNAAKLLAFEMKGRIPIITVAEHLEGVAHVFANQLNENAKNFSEYRVIPELNHHLMEGLKFPDGNDNNLFFFLVDSALYKTNNSQRLHLTKQVIDKHEIPNQVLSLESSSKLGQAFEFLVLSAYTNFYLAMLNNINPSPIPWVDWFKAELKK